MAASRVIGFVLALIVSAEYTGWSVLDQATVAVVVVLVAAFVWSRWSLRGIGFERRLASDRASVGEHLHETLRLSNKSWLPKLWVEVWDFSTLPGYRANRILQVGGRAARRWQVSALCEQRGAFRLGPVTVRAGDPLGLFQRRKTLPVVHDVLIYPATLDVSGFQMPTSVLSGGRATSSKHPMETSTIAGVRDYTPGDPLNRISWAATARGGKLMTKEFDLDPTSDVWIVLDLDSAQYAPASYGVDHPAHREPVAPWLASTEEYAVTIAASLAKRCLDEGRVVGMIASGNHLEVLLPDRSERQYIKVLETLALLHADGTMPLAECLTVEARRFQRQSVVVVVTSSASDDWVRPLLELTRRGILATVVMIEQDTFSPAPSSLMVVSALTSMEIPVVLVKHGDDISRALNTGVAKAPRRSERHIHG
jgi:uncharacterized protein (DUF58 family)